MSPLCVQHVLFAVLMLNTTTKIMHARFISARSIYKDRNKIPRAGPIITPLYDNPTTESCCNLTTTKSPMILATTSQITAATITMTATTISEEATSTESRINKTRIEDIMKLMEPQTGDDQDLYPTIIKDDDGDETLETPVADQQQQQQQLTATEAVTISIQTPTLRPGFVRLTIVPISNEDLNLSETTTPTLKSDEVPTTMATVHPTSIVLITVENRQGTQQASRASSSKNEDTEIKHKWTADKTVRIEHSDDQNSERMLPLLQSPTITI